MPLRDDRGSISEGGKMSAATLTRAWSDVDFRDSLTADERELVAENPAGDLDMELNELLVHEATGVTTICTQWSGGKFCCC